MLKLKYSLTKCNLFKGGVKNEFSKSIIFFG